MHRASQTQAEYNAAVQAQARKVGTRPSNSDGLTMSDKGTLYLGGLTTSALYEWPNPVTATSGGAPFTCDQDAAPSSACPLKVLHQNETLLNWIDTFAWDDTGGLIFTSNRLQLFFDSTYNFSAGAPANFRVLRLDVGAGSYLQGELGSGVEGEAEH